VNDAHDHIANIQKPFTFAVVGDVHYGLPSAQTEHSLGDGERNLSQAERHAENVGYAFEPMLESLKEQDLAFTVQTGDLASCEGDPAETLAAVRALRRVGPPTMFARGDYDTVDTFNEVVLPRIRALTGEEGSGAYYTIEVGGCHLVFLDTVSWDPEGEQAEWLKTTLNNASERGGRILVFGHHPVWTVAKAFFSNRVFCESVSEIFASTGIDAYFCGHTHNQNALSYRVGGQHCLQFMGAPIGHSDELPTPLSRVQTLLVDPDRVVECWPGYLENTAPGWYLVRVEEDGVQVTWNHLNRGAELDVAWKAAGHIDRFWSVRHPEDAVLITKDLQQLRRLTLRFCAWDAIRPGKRVRLNGIDVGELPPSAQFTPQQVDLPPSSVNALDVLNRVEIEAPGVEASTIGNIQLEGILPGGRIVRTKPTGDVFTWSDRWAPWQLPRLQKVMPGRPLRTLLSFQ